MQRWGCPENSAPELCGRCVAHLEIWCARDVVPLTKELSRYIHVGGHTSKALIIIYSHDVAVF